MQLLLIRHGTTSWNEELRYQGWTDIPLSFKGREEALALSELLADEHVDAVWSSDLTRCRTTAELVFPDLHITTNEALREIRLGVWEGSTYTQCLADHKDGYQSWIDDPSSYTPPDGDSLDQFENRIYDAIDSIVAYATEKGFTRVAVVTHGGVIRAILRRVQNTSPTEGYRVHIPQCQVIRLDYSQSSDALIATATFSGE